MVRFADAEKNWQAWLASDVYCNATLEVRKQVLKLWNTVKRELLIEEGLWKNYRYLTSLEIPKDIELGDKAMGVYYGFIKFIVEYNNDTELNIVIRVLSDDILKLVAEYETLITVQDVRESWKIWLNATKAKHQKALDLFYAFGEAVIKENGFSCTKDAIGKIPHSTPLGGESKNAFKLLLEFINENAPGKQGGRR